MSTFMNTVQTRPNNPAARVIVNGLALLCFSRRNERAEVGCLNVEGHDLFFTIYDSECNVYRDADGAAVSYLIENGTIEINADNPGIGSLFYPANPKDDVGFRHMLSLDRIHAEFGKGRLSIKQNVDFLARLYINKGVFYTETLSAKRAKIHVYGDASKEIIAPQQVGKIFGADIDDPVVKINITTASFRKTIELNKSANPYSIVIRYKCCDGPSAETDFERYYEVLNLPAKHEVTDLIFEEPEEPYLHPCERKLMNIFEKDSGSAKESENVKSLAQLIDNLRRAREACEVSTLPDCPHNLGGVPEPCD